MKGDLKSVFIKEVFYSSEKFSKEVINAFCCYYVVLGDTVEAALKAGFPPETALLNGIECLKSSSCRKKIAEIKNILSKNTSVTAGLNRLAFGNCNDAVILAFAEELPPSHVIERLDLFNVSEIRRVKGGGVEVKLFDRLKALEKLYELENAFDNKDKAVSLVNALNLSVKGGDDYEY